MPHHIVTVCVVCVLCAAHTPCSAHNEFMKAQKIPHQLSTLEKVDSTEQMRQSWVLRKSHEEKDLKDQKANMNTLKYGANNKSYYIQKDNGGKQITAETIAVATDRVHLKKTNLDPVNGKKCIVNTSSPTVTEESSDKQNAEILERLGQVDLAISKTITKSEENNNRVNKLRARRDLNTNERYFMKKIFEAYGDGTSVTMEGFEKLLRRLGLLRLLTDISTLDSNSGDTSYSKNELGSVTNLQNNGLHNNNNGSVKERCLSSKELLNIVAQDVPYHMDINNSAILPNWLFERVCPALVYHLAGDSASEQNGCIRMPENYKPIIFDNYISDEGTRNMFQVWVYSTISILVISLCGLLGVAVIPVMGKSYYHQLLQFLVALAVGTLCGDALIHLLPHAMMTHEHEHNDHDHDHNHEGENSNNAITSHEEQHNLNMWKGLVAMVGLVLFFFTEKALTMLAEWRKHRQRRNKLPSRVRVMRETDGPNSNVVGEKLCKHKYSSYPYCYGEITTETQDNHHNRQHNNHEKPPIIEEEKPLASNCNSVSKIMSSDLDKKANEDWRLDESMVNSTKKDADGADVPLNESESYTVIIREHETKHHGHTHSHGHVHSAPESMSSVAWMVVMGDGLHNFTDGMAIGAAFSANIAGGFSTAIAVFCHELPHELGDFAVLLKAGMSAKQAVFYNLLSSVLCLFGMVFGVLLGSTPAASSWMFAAAAGMFIYIALVDMIPELSSSHSAERGSQWQCILQALGLLLGLGIMLVIALYEHDLKRIFSN